MSLPLVNIFNTPYESWTTRVATPEEMMAAFKITGFMNPNINDKLILRVTSPLEAAMHIAGVGADNSLGNYINSALDASDDYISWRHLMPSSTPKELSNYQKFYPKCDFNKVNQEINQYGHILSDGQHLFHGGLWPSGVNKLVTARPLSTTFCPQVALRNAEHNDKAYDSGRIDLFVLSACSPKTKVFNYRRKGTNLGHENEVLFAAGAELILLNQILVSRSYSVSKWGLPIKNIPIYVLEVAIS